MTGVQRFHGSMQALKTCAWAALIVPLLALPMCFPFIGNEERYGEVFSHRTSIRYMYIVVWAATKVWKRIVFTHLGAMNISSLSKNRYWITPYIVYSFYQSFWVNLEETEFKISGTFKSPVDERSVKTRPALWTRMTNPLVLMHTIYWLVASGGFLAWVLSIGRGIALGNRSLAFIHTGVTVRLFDIVLAALVPVRYMAFPPYALNRRVLLSKDDVGAYRVVTKTWTKRGDNAVSSMELVELLIIVACDWL